MVLLVLVCGVVLKRDFSVCSCCMWWICFCFVFLCLNWVVGWVLFLLGYMSDKFNNTIMFL